MNRKDYQRGIRKAFGNDEESDKKKKKTYQERLDERLAKMSPEEIAERNRKIEAQKGPQSYEDGGMPESEEDKKAKLRALAKLVKSQG